MKDEGMAEHKKSLQDGGLDGGLDDGVAERDRSKEDLGMEISELGELGAERGGTSEANKIKGLQ